MKSVLFLVIVFISSIAIAQNQKEAENILQKVSSTLESYQNIEIHFNHILENKMVNIKQESEGNAIIENDKYLLNYLGNTILFDEKNQYIISPENEEVNVSTIEDLDDSSLTPTKLLYFYKKGYKYTLDKKESQNGKNIQFIKLVPTEKSEEVAYVLLGINTKTYRIDSLNEVGINGTNTSFVISDYIVDQSLPTDIFTFNKAKYEALNYIINE